MGPARAQGFVGLKRSLRLDLRLGIRGSWSSRRTVVWTSTGTLTKNRLRLVQAEPQSVTGHLALIAVSLPSFPSIRLSHRSEASKRQPRNHAVVGGSTYSEAGMSCSLAFSARRPKSRTLNKRLAACASQLIRKALQLLETSSAYRS